MTNNIYSENFFRPIIDASEYTYEYVYNKTKEFTYGYVDLNFIYKIVGASIVGYYEGQEDALSDSSSGYEY